MIGLISKYRRVIAIVFLILSAVPVRAQNAPPVPKLPILESTTFLFGRIDLKQIDIDALSKWLADQLATADIPEADRAAVLKEIQTNFERLKVGIKALTDSGATEIYFAASDPIAGPFLYLPVAPGGNVEAVRIAIRNGRPTGTPGPNPETAPPQVTVSAQLGDGVFMGPAGKWKQLKEQHPGAPHLVFALSNAPAAPFQFVAAPSEDLQRMLEDRMPQIPAPIEMPMTTVTRGIASAVLTGQLPPNGSARLVVQATDAQAAGQLKTVADKYLAFLTSPLLQQVMPDVDFQKIAATLTPQMKEDQLVLAWDDAQAGSAVKPFSKYVVMQLTRARLAATRVQSASNMRLISLAIINYAQRNQGNLPDKLEQLEKAIPPQVLIDPRGGAAQPDYIYHKPAETINQVKTPGETILVYENPDDVTRDSIINMAFADGHIDAVPRERAIQMIKALDAAVPQK